MLFDDVLSIRAWLDADRDTPYGERLQRDRVLGRRSGGKSDEERVLHWWRATAGADGTAPKGMPRHGAALRLLTLSCGFVGVLLGVGVALTAFHYDGIHPINVFVVLGLTVAIPVLLLIPTLLALLPATTSIEAGLLSLSPVRVAAAAIDQHLGMNLFAGAAAGAGRRYAKWFAIAASQWLAVAFYAGLLGCTMLLLIFTDLAFGWSSTVSLSAEAVTRFTAILALPWSALAPGAIPSPELIEQSRFVRMSDLAPGIAARLGDWWPFLFFSIVVYGFLPRVGLLALALWRRETALRGLLLNDPEVVGLLERLSHPLVTPEARIPETAAQPGPRTPEPAPDGHGQTALGLIWNDAVDDSGARLLAKTLGYGLAAPCLTATSSQPDVEVPGDSERILIVTKGWEPPMLEFHDFLTQLRAGAPTATLVVVPANLDANGIDAADYGVWSDSVARAPAGNVFVAGAT